MSKTEYNVDLCIIGAGSGGLSIASGAAQLGRSVVMYEAEEMGGDCLNYGCVPSKALIAAGKHAHAFSTGAAFGIKAAKPKIDFEAVKAHIKDVIATIAPADSQERFEGLGAIVIRERASFSDAKTIESDTTITRAKRIVVATGSRASAPPIPGLADTPYLTNENIFDVPELPKKLLVIGAGPIGLELGQAFNRLGSDVEIIDIAPPLPRNEPEHVDVLVNTLKDEGIFFHTPVKTKLIRKTRANKKAGTAAGVAIELEDGRTIKGSHLLVAAGRKPAIDGLNLEAAGVKTNRGGIITDDTLKSSNPKVYAVGDVSGRGGLTHAAGYHAGIIIKNFYFVPFFNSSADTEQMPAAIYSEPELANIGYSEAAAREKYGDAVRVVHWEFEENDRAIAERDTDGGIKIICRKNGRIIGASAVGSGAGDLIQMVGLAMGNKMKIIAFTKYISPYPTRAEVAKRAAGNWYKDTVFSPKTRKLAGILAKFH
ncbi:MAG: dihydrolipoamide dehydrogenase [Acidimicrobiales bacterium]|nr:FAD-dependent oxidoreductase [Hyphomonadaceae bacterium]RZV41930.1 MAG: dihydrolipoamide dehydrogenase [Acidimicrobiales bacterium]